MKNSGKLECIHRILTPRAAESFCMTDYSEAEIGALEASFPGTTVYLCDFHREQAWEKWIHDKNMA